MRYRHQASNLALDLDLAHGSSFASVGAARWLASIEGTAQGARCGDRSDPGIEASDVISMFPTSLWKISLKAVLARRDRCMDFVAALVEHEAQSASRSSLVRAGSRNERCTDAQDFWNSSLASAILRDGFCDFWHCQDVSRRS